MGVAVKLQAKPPECELLETASVNFRAVSWMWSFQRIKREGSYYPKSHQTKGQAQLDQLALQVIKENPGIEDRYFWGNRKHDQILYLLSPVRRGEVDSKEDNSLFNLAIHGEKLVHPKEYTYYISTPTVERILHFMQSVTIDEMRKHFDKDIMIQEVYKFGTDTTRDVYVSASEHNEAMLTRID